MFGEGMGRIWLDNVQCTGSEQRLIDCMANSSGINSCMHTQDAGVRCSLGRVYCSIKLLVSYPAHFNLRCVSLILIDRKYFILIQRSSIVSTIYGDV